MEQSVVFFYSFSMNNFRYCVSIISCTICVLLLPVSVTISSNFIFCFGVHLTLILVHFPEYGCWYCFAPIFHQPLFFSLLYHLTLCFTSFFLKIFWSVFLHDLLRSKNLAKKYSNKMPNKKSPPRRRRAESPAGNEPRGVGGGTEGGSPYPTSPLFPA